MSLAGAVAALASRLATEFNSVGMALAAKANTDHTHPPAAVYAVPRTATTGGGAVEVTGAAAGDVQLTCTGNPTITPTGTPDGRMLLIECHASGGQRVATIAGSVATVGGLDRALTIPAGQTGIFGLRYSSLAGGWLLLAAAVQD